MTRAEAINTIRGRAATDHPACVNAINLLLDDTTRRMSAHVAMHKGLNPTGHQAGFLNAYRTAVQHIEEALFEAFGIWPDTTTGDPS